MKNPIINVEEIRILSFLDHQKITSKKSKFILRFLLVAMCSFFLKSENARAQCTVVANAVPGVTLTYVQGGGTNATGVAFNPTLSLYYAAIAGNTGFPLETFSATGAPLFQTNTGFDMRGMWWNPNTNQLESNGYNTGGIWKYNLNASGYALNTGISIFTGMNQPTAQSNGDYNCADNEIVYYNAGAIMRRNRTTNALIGSLAITGLPVALGNLNDNTICYTDCLAHEYALLDYVLKRVYFINKATGAYNGMSQLPATAVTNVSFRTSWANGLFWIYNTANLTWYSYQVLTGISGVCSFPVCTPPTLVINNLTACSPNTVNLNAAINVASNPGNATFYSTLANANAATSPISNIASASGTYYVRLETLTDATCFSVAVPVLPPQGFHQRITYSNLPGPVRRAVQQHQCSGGIDFGRGSGHGANQRGETDGGLARLSGAACFWGSSPVAGDCGRELCGGESALFRPPCQTGFVRHPAGAYGGSG